MARNNIRGGDKLLRILRNAGLLEDAVWHQLSDRIQIAFPLVWEEVNMDRQDLLQYEVDLMEALEKELQGQQDITLIDCGAHLGAFSALLSSRVPEISRVIAVEPNPELQALLTCNIEALPMDSRRIAAAVCNFSGTGRLESPDYDSYSRAKFLIPDAEGPIPVTTVDDLEVRGGNCIIKIDVEGAEEEVIEGARETIRAAGTCTVVFEAQPYVAKRIGRDPSYCMQKLQEIRPFQFRVAETGQMVKDTSQPVFGDGGPEQYEIWNIIARTY